MDKNFIYMCVCVLPNQHLTFSFLMFVTTMDTINPILYFIDGNTLIH